MHNIGSKNRFRIRGLVHSASAASAAAAAAMESIDWIIYIVHMSLADTNQTDLGWSWTLFTGANIHTNVLTHTYTRILTTMDMYCVVLIYAHFARVLYVFMGFGL